MMAATMVGCSGLAAQDVPIDLLPLLPKWDHVFTVKGGGGYKDNLSLSHFQPESSAFLSAGGEAIVNRLYEDGSELSFYLNGDQRWFLSHASVDQETLALGQARFKQVLGSRTSASLAAEYFYQDQVVDVSVTETNRQAVRAIGNTLTARPGFRYTFGDEFWAAIELPVTRQLFASPLDDYWEFGPKLSVGRDYARKSSLVFSYQGSWAFYDTDSEVTADGRSIPGTHREINAHDVRLTWRHHWDESRRWRTTLKGGTKFNVDNGSGYFDFVRPYAAAEVRYRQRPWELALEGRCSYYHYPVQTVSDTDPSNRARTEIGLEVRGERKLYKGLKVVGAYEYERVLSNDELETYRVNTVSGSVWWEF